MSGPYTFQQIFAADPSNTANVAKNASILLFDPADPTMKPLTITDVNTGLALANPLPTNANGWGPMFNHATLDQVAWSGGGFKGTFESYRGMKDVAVAAASSASASAGSAALAATNAAGAVDAVLADVVADSEAAKVAAQQAAALVGAPADTVTAALVGNPATLTGAALNATFVPKWKATTAYLAGDKVLNPGGDVVSAKVDFTSGASYSSANWDLSASYVQVPSVTTSATVFVAATGGNDSNDGSTWKRAKATIAAAIAALPTDGGVIELGGGIHQVSSTGRWDSCTFTSGSQTVTDSSAASGDVGSWVISPYVPDLVQITAVTAGVSFTLSAPANASGTVNSIITRPGIVLNAGVTIQGRGSSYTANAQPQYGPQPSSTMIRDMGTGITMLPNKVYASTNTSQNFSTISVKNLTLDGNTKTALGGFWGINIWYGEFDNVTFQEYSMIGAALGCNMNSTSFRRCRFLHIGNSNSAIVTAGLLLSSPNSTASSSVEISECFFSDIRGWGVVATSNSHGTTPWTAVRGVMGVTFANTQWNHIGTTAIGGSGTGAWVSGENGVTTLTGCWFETCNATPLIVVGDNGSVTAIGCHFNGQMDPSGQNANAVEVRNASFGGARTSGFVAIGCYFENIGSVYVNVSSSANFAWMGCAVYAADTTKPFATLNGSTVATLAQAQGVGHAGRYSSKDVRTLATMQASGKVTLVAGSVSVADTAITANSIVRLSRQAAGGTLGQLSVALTAGTGFAINSNSGADTSTVYYEVVSY